MPPRSCLSLLLAAALACSSSEPTALKVEFIGGCQTVPTLSATPATATVPPQTSAQATFLAKSNCSSVGVWTTSVSRTGAVVSAGPADVVNLTLNAGQSKNVLVPYTTGSPGTGTVVLKLSGGSPTISTSATLGVTVSGGTSGIPFGLWGLVVGPTVTPGPWTGGTGCCKDPAQTLKQLADAKARGIKMWFSPVGHDDAIGSTGDFDVTVWKQQFDKHQSNYAAYNEQYVPGGTYQGMILLDDITRAGWSVSFNDIETIAAYAEARIHVPTAVRQHAASMPAGTYVNLDIAWSQYSARLGDVTAYRNNQTAAATSKSLGVLFGLNILNGGVRKDKRPANDPCWPGTGDPINCNMSPTELRNYGSVLGAYPGTCAFMMWRNDATYLNRPGVMDAMNDLGAQMRSHPATSCVH
jgi:hypothetical protein